MSDYARSGIASTPNSDPGAIVGKTPRDTAIRLLAASYWPIPLKAFDDPTVAPDNRGKPPIGAGWATKRHTVDTLAKAWRKTPRAGVGVVLGPDRAPQGGWLIDVEGDGPEAEDSRATLFAGELVATLGWKATRGQHELFTVDPGRIAALMARLGAGDTGVLKLSELPGLELRIGGHKPDGTPKQLQSVMPPTLGTDGKPREWNGVSTVAIAPEAFYATLEAIATAREQAAAAAARPAPAKPRKRGPTGPMSPEDRAIAYLAKCEPAISGERGHDKAFKAACKVGPGFDLPSEVTFRLIRDVYNPTCQPPWSDKELWHKVEDAYKVEARRGWLLNADRNGHHGKNGKAAPSSNDAPHGDQRNDDPEVPRFAGGFDSETTGRPIIRITADYHLCVTDAAEALAGHPDIFTRGSELARVVRHQGNRDAEKGLRRDAGSPMILPLDVDTARVFLSRTAQFQKYSKRERSWDFIPPTRDLTASVLGLKSYQSGRELVGIIEAPTIRPDGSLLDTPGYDPATGLLYVPNADYPAIPERPTLDQAKHALGGLLALVADFPFEAESDRAAWLAYLLTTLARGAVEGPVPMFMFSANVAGIGKTTLAELPALIATGRYPAMDGYTPDDAEMEKRLTALAIAGDRCVIFDNADNGSRIGGAPLDRAIMAKGAFRGRILGSSKMSPHAVPWSAVVSVTGNNVSTRSDLRRRVIPCYLKSEVAKPEERDPSDFSIFKATGKSLEAWILDTRPRLVAAALVLLRAYVAAGRPKMGLKAMDFPAWSNLIREAVAWVYDFDPAGSRDRLEDEDETMSNRVRLVLAWRMLCEAIDSDGSEQDPTKLTVNCGITTAEAAARLSKWNDQRPGLKDHPEVLEAFSVFAPKGSPLPDATRLGHALKREKGAPTAFGSLVHGSPYRGNYRWRVEDYVAPSGI